MILKTLKLNIANRGLVTNCYIIVDEKTLSVLMNASIKYAMLNVSKQ